MPRCNMSGQLPLLVVKAALPSAPTTPGETVLAGMIAWWISWPLHSMNRANGADGVGSDS